MVQAMGVYSALHLIAETAFKIPPADYTGKVLNLPFNSNGVSGTQNTTDPATMTGRRDAVEAIYGNIDVTGDIVVPMDSNAIGYWLAFAFGAPTTVAGTTEGTYVHTFKPSNIQPSAMIEKAFNNGVYVVSNGNKVNSLSTTFGGDGELTLSANISGCEEELKSTALSPAPVDVPFKRLNNFQAALKIDGVEQQIVTQATLEVAFNLDTEGFALGGNGFRSRINEGTIKPSGTLTAFFDDKTYLEKAINSTKVSLEFTVTGANGTLSIRLPEAKFARKTPGIEGQTGITQELDYSAFYDNNEDNSCIVVTLTNTTATYTF